MATSRTEKPDTQALSTTLAAAMPEIRKLAPKYVKIERLMALALEAKLRNPLLANTSLESVIMFCKRCAEWGTDRVGAGGVWPVPFWNKKTGGHDMVAIPDWRLLIEKAKRAGAITHATADVVRDGDQFTFSRGMHPDLFHAPKIDNPGAIIAAYCVYTLPDSSRDFAVMGWQEIEAIRDRSNAWKGYLKDKARTCPWNTDEAEMSKKTIVKRAMKIFEGASIELTAILEADHALLGSDIFEPPAPIAMPRVIEIPVEASAAPQPEPMPPPVETVQEPPAPENRQPEISDGRITITIQDVVVKSGVTKGKPWTKWNIIAQDRTIYGTFDSVIGEQAQDWRGETVTVTWKRDGKYLTCTGIGPASQEDEVQIENEVYGVRTVDESVPF